jgi:hypothetical protein
MNFEFSRRRHCRLGAAAIGIASIVLLGLAPSARASLLFSVQSVSASPGDVNDHFEVDVTNIGAGSVQLSAFNFVIQTSSSDITLKQATTATLLSPYVFAGNSLFGPVISTSAPGQSLSASDLPANTNATVIGSLVTFGLGEVSFDVAPGAPAEILSIVFNTNSNNTSALDPSGALIPLDFSNGQITIRSATPLPAALPLFATGIGGLGLLGWRRKRKARPIA